MSVEYVDHMGSDDAVVDAARVSFAKQAANYTPEQNEKLIKFLARSQHWSPFAHTAIKLRVGAPVPIRTQCFKHKQGLVENEESRRYISSRPELFIPDVFRAAPTNGAKQGSSSEPADNHQLWMAAYKVMAHKSINLYEDMIKGGVAPEQARFILPQGVIVNWIWTGNLYSFANFYNKRIDPHAQKEIRDVAVEVGKIIEPLFPVSWKALTNAEKSIS